MIDLLAAITLTVIPQVAAAKPDDWRGFRGPGARATLTDTRIPTRWSDTENIGWKTELPGPGASSPIVVGEQVFLTCWSGYGLDRANPGDPTALERHLLCLDRGTGEILWTATVDPVEAEDPYAGRMTIHGYASSTPVSDGEQVYVFFGKSGVFAFDLEGSEIWQADVGKGSSEWKTGSAASPVLYGDLVIVNAADESRSIRALDKETGDEIWRRDDEGLDLAFDTPILVRSGESVDLVLALLESMWGLDPETGDLRWSVTTKTNGSLAPTIIPAEGILYSLGGQEGTQSYAIRLGGSGDVTDTHVKWSSRWGSYVTSPVLVNGHLYWVNEGGIAFCVVAETGEKVYQERLDGTFYASGVVAGDRLMYVSQENGTFVLPAKPEFEVLSHNVLESDPSKFDGSPALTRERLFLRSRRFCYAIEKVTAEN